jgi:hypothetical protein
MSDLAEGARGRPHGLKREETRQSLARGGAAPPGVLPTPPARDAARRDVSPLSSIDIAGIAHRARDGNDPRGEPEFVERSVEGRDPEIPMWPEPRKPYEFNTHRL